MHAWKEGAAFYTCEHEKTHWMEEIFYCEHQKVIDLFNIKNDWWRYEISNPDDIFPTSEFNQCKCGAMRREMNFMPHASRWFHDLNYNLLNAKAIRFYND
jgi:hypothetical protein